MFIRSCRLKSFRPLTPCCGQAGMAIDRVAVAAMKVSLRTTGLIGSFRRFLQSALGNSCRTVVRTRATERMADVAINGVSLDFVEVENLEVRVGIETMHGVDST
jgi:hypothetical protein